jgi:hypothetical protein
MPHTQNKEVWYFNELSEKAKDKAREWYRTKQFNYDWWDDIYDNVKTAASYLGIEIDKKPVTLMSGKTWYAPAIYFSGFSSQGDGASFLGTWRANNMKTTVELSAEFPTDETLLNIHATLWEYKTVYPGSYCTSTRGNCMYSHERSTNLEAVLAEDRDYNRQECEPLEECVVDFMKWIYDELETEYEYLTSDEYVDENIRANEYEFTEEGSIA